MVNAIHTTLSCALIKKKNKKPNADNNRALSSDCTSNCTTIQPANSLNQMIFVYGLVFGAAIHVSEKQNNFINVRAFCRHQRKYLTLLLSPI